jgi:hypothetical protein
MKHDARSKEVLQSESDIQEISMKRAVPRGGNLCGLLPVSVIDGEKRNRAELYVGAGFSRALSRAAKQNFPTSHSELAEAGKESLFDLTQHIFASPLPAALAAKGRKRTGHANENQQRKHDRKKVEHVAPPTHEEGVQEPCQSASCLSALLSI